MGDSWDIVGSFRLAHSGRSIRITLDSYFLGEVIIGLKDLEKVKSGKKKNGTVYQLLKSDSE